MNTYLREYYRMPVDEIFEFIKYIESQVFDNIRKEFSRQLREIYTYAIESFRNKFWYINNEQRQWNRMDEKEIDELFKKCRAEYVDLFDTFRLLKVASPVKCI